MIIVYVNLLKTLLIQAYTYIMLYYCISSLLIIISNDFAIIVCSTSMYNRYNNVVTLSAEFPEHKQNHFNNISLLLIHKLYIIDSVHINLMRVCTHV